jgi:DNA-binding NtrC family response regulator
MKQRPGAPKQLLVVDDDSAVVDYLCESLNAEGYAASGLTSSVEALKRIQNEDFDLVISDVEMPELRGVDLLRAILEAKPAQLVLLITAYGSVEMAVAAVRDGACDFLTKPFKIEALLLAIERAFSERTLQREVVRLRTQLSKTQGPASVIAKSPAMRRVLDLARRAATSSAPVLITGETGSGKSVLARFIHESSARASQPFLQLNCAAIPPTLAESELFGVRKGAFTDAREDRDGLFVAAGGGTLFLDEIGELTPEVQAKLLHALETGTVRPLGRSTEVKVQARVITATNRVPETLLREGKLRPDLYYRTNVVRLEVPPLRERKDDVVPLVDAFLARASEGHQRPLIGISSRAMKLLVRHPWPGNVRELANVIERAVVMAEHDTILPEDLSFPGAESGAPPVLGSALERGLSLEEMERAYVQQVLEAQGGNKAAAAKLLGITRRTLYRKLGIDQK